MDRRTVLDAASVAGTKRPDPVTRDNEILSWLVGLERFSGVCNNCLNSQLYTKNNHVLGYQFSYLRP